MHVSELVVCCNMWSVGAVTLLALRCLEEDNDEEAEDGGKVAGEGAGEEAEQREDHGGGMEGNVKADSLRSALLAPSQTVSVSCAVPAIATLVSSASGEVWAGGSSELKG